MANSRPANLSTRFGCWPQAFALTPVPTLTLMPFAVVNDVGDLDEYTYDPYSGIDFDTIPELGRITQPLDSQSEITQGHEVGQPDGTQHQSVVGRACRSYTSVTDSTTVLQTPGVVHEQQQAQGSARTAKERSPSTSYSDDEYDSDFLAQVDLIESTALSQAALASASDTTESNAPSHQEACDESQGTSNDPREVETVSLVERISRKRSLSQSPENKTPRDQHPARQKSPPDVSPNSQGSAKKLKKLMDNFEDEMTCPICCDIFACAHLLNPCGHSYCGDCALGWIMKNSSNAVCAVCRAPMAKRNPMVPNITLDNTVQRHVDALRENGVVGWQEDGDKWAEWNQRKERWKTDGLSRLDSAKKERRKKKRGL